MMASTMIAAGTPGASLEARRIWFIRDVVGDGTDLALVLFVLLLRGCSRPSARRQAGGLEVWTRPPRRWL